jgi:uncharacterized protein (DUF488 family)
MKVFTIGFTRKTAEQFFGKLQRPGLERVVDIRLNNLSQLAGFAKRDDLRYFLKTICAIEYVHLPELAPTAEILREYRKGKGDWSAYERRFEALMASRRIEDTVPREIVDGGCLLCSEQRPDRCHRRLVAEYLAKKWGDVEIEHIV